MENRHHIYYLEPAQKIRVCWETNSLNRKCHLAKKSTIKQLHQLMEKIFHFTHLKPTFSILHSHFYKTPTSVCLLYTFIQIKIHFLNTIISLTDPTQPHNHHHQATTIINPFNLAI